MQQQVKRKNSHLGLIIVISTLAVLMFILVTTVIVLFFANQLGAAGPMPRNALTGTSPLNMVDVDEVDPALALASLGGVLDVDVISEAISKNRPETALAALLFQPTLTDKESAGSFLLLATAYLEDGQPEKGVFCYQTAGTIATISPDIPDTVRADVFLQAGEALVELNEPGLARFYLDQAFIVASKSPFLQAVHRRSIFERLQKSYIIIGERELARESLNLSASPPPLSSPVSEGPILPRYEPVPLPALVQEAEAIRWTRAQELAALLVERGGNAPQANRDALREALIAEDQQKLPFYQGELATTAQLSRKIDITAAEIEWLTIKYRVARGAYGISLVPEWEAQVEQIRADLTKTYELLFTLYADLSVALPEASQIDVATEERLRREILAGELGRYPNYPEEQRQKQLLDATSQLITTQPDLKIFVGVEIVGDQEMYTLISQE